MSELKDLSQKILHQIEEKQIAPKSKWSFLLKDWLVWVFSFISVLIGAIAVAVMIFIVRNNDFAIYQELGLGTGGMVLRSLPYIWFVFFAAFIVVAHYNFRHTKEGYKFKLSTIIAGTFLASVVLGTGFYWIGLGRLVDDRLASMAAPYRQFVHPEHARWLQPEEGLLSGRVGDIENEHHFILIDKTGKEWRIIVLPNAIPPQLQSVLTIETDEELRLFGRPIGVDSFEAKRVFPWDVNGREQRFLQTLRKPLDANERRIIPLRTSN